ncbi:MAG TPA: DNA repair protein RecO [Nevskiales bacterium]|nr:DNA repair protein RecO [Nevskiales bacterium]
MSGQRVQLQPAFVLHRRPYRETSWLLEVFSRDHGRIGLVARAARQARPHSSMLEPARELLLSWSLRGELGLLGQAETASAAPALEGETLLAILYLNELLLRLVTRHDPHPQLYEHYRAAVAALATGSVAVPLRRFERVLLQELGYGLNLENDGNGEAIRADARYEYRSGQGFWPLRGQAAELALEGATLIALREDRLDEAQAFGEARQLLRLALRAHLGPRPLRTPELFRSLRRLRNPQAVNSESRS